MRKYYPIPLDKLDLFVTDENINTKKIFVYFYNHGKPDFGYLTARCYTNDIDGKDIVLYFASTFVTRDLRLLDREEIVKFLINEKIYSN